LDRLFCRASSPAEVAIEPCDFRELESRVGDLTGKIDMVWLLMDPPRREEFPSIRVPMDEVAVPRSLFAAILERID
jgi:hypothetical protein